MERALSLMANMKASSTKPFSLKFKSHFPQSETNHDVANEWFDATTSTGATWHFDTLVEDETFVNAGDGSAGFFETHISNPGSVVGNGEIPEPTTLMIWSGLGLGLAFSGRRRRRVKA